MMPRRASTPMTTPAMAPPPREEDVDVDVGTVAAGRVLVAMPTGQEPVGSISPVTHADADELAT
jgi:hypothetical protein